MDISGSVERLRGLQESSDFQFLFESESSEDSFQVESELKPHGITNRSVTQPAESHPDSNEDPGFFLSLLQKREQKYRLTHNSQQRQIDTLQQEVNKLTASLRASQAEVELLKSALLCEQLKVAQVKQEYEEVLGEVKAEFHRILQGKEHLLSEKMRECYELEVNHQAELEIMEQRHTDELFRVRTSQAHLDLQELLRSQQSTIKYLRAATAEKQRLVESYETALDKLSQEFYCRKKVPE